MMRAMLFPLAICVVCVASATGADNVKNVEAMLRTHADAVNKANQLRQRAVERSRDDTIVQLVKLAGQAYREKDRLGETTSWKAMLKLDRSGKRARQYFSDLGTLDQVLKELPDVAHADGTPAMWKEGKWEVLYDSKARTTVTLSSDGIARRSGDQASKIVVEDGAMILRFPGLIERWTIARNKCLVEQWPASADYQKSLPNNFGYAVQAN